jgi:HD-GYP domain-containing protein (c-di-GMP phosphodiesterase class II)
VPAVAAMHHEKLNGKGYPFALSGDDILVQGRIMAIADIFDALTAQDRPYKKAMPLEKACAILMEEGERNVLDIDIVKFFIENEIYKCLDRRGS